MKIELNKLVDGLYYFSTLLRKGYTCTTVDGKKSRTSWGW